MSVYRGKRQNDGVKRQCRKQTAEATIPMRSQVPAHDEGVQSITVRSFPNGSVERFAS